MIFAFEPERRSQDEYIVCPPRSLSIGELRERMLQRAQVTDGSYAWQLIDNLHAAIFVQSLDLKADFEIYFAVEYRSFERYLRRRTHLPPSLMAKLLQAFETSGGMYHFKPSGYSFLSETYGLDFLKKLIENGAAEEAP
jgi:hypothetical protein